MTHGSLTLPPLRTVIVDDDVAVAALHERFVAAHPDFVAVATAHSGPEAAQVIAATDPDLVLLDFYLPGLSGLDVLRELRARDGRQPEVIAVTAARDVDSVREARAAGVRHYLVKPFTAVELRARLDDIVRDRHVLAGSDAGRRLDQEAIDSLMTGTAPRQAVLPKGLSAETLESVTRALSQSPDSTASDLGILAGISRVSCRRYLEHLVAAGRATRALDYSTAGRPSSRYRAIS